ncbi:MAG: hypothetical protein M1347_02895 [Chloroflexi bacterium]|nr:hypothetical protein [Chloroflexota bacterium]
MAGDESLLEGLHEFGDLGSGFGWEGRGDSQKVGTIATEVFDGVPFFDENIEAPASVAAILCKDAAELGQRAGTGIAQGDEGFFLALGDIGQGQDGLFLSIGTKVDLALPLGGVGKGGVERGSGIEAILQGALDADCEQVPGPVEMV